MWLPEPRLARPLGTRACAAAGSKAWWRREFRGSWGAVLGLHRHVTTHWRWEAAAAWALRGTAERALLPFLSGTSPWTSGPACPPPVCNPGSSATLSWVCMSPCTWAPALPQDLCPQTIANVHGCTRSNSWPAESC